VTLLSDSYRYQVVFEGVRGQTYFSDIGIDDVSFTQGSCGRGMFSIIWLFISQICF